MIAPTKIKRWDVVLEEILRVLDDDDALSDAINDTIKPSDDSSEVSVPSLTYSTIWNVHFNENESELYLTLNIWARSKSHASDIEYKIFELFDNQRSYVNYNSDLFMFCDVLRSMDIDDPEPNVARRVAEYRFVVAKY